MREFGSQHRWLEQQPTRIGREHIRPLCRDAAATADDAERSLVAMMTWGAIDFGYRCKWTKDMLATTAVRDRLVDAARTLASAGPVAAYGRLHHTGDCHIDRLGEAFLTKWLYFCQPDGAPLRALILDSYVNEWFGRECALTLSRGRGSARDYGNYLAAMHRWGSQLGVSAEDVELCVFRDEARRRNGGWGA